MRGEIEIIISLAKEETKRGVSELQAIKNAQKQFHIALEHSLSFEYESEDSERERVIIENLGLVYDIAIKRFGFTKTYGLFDDLVNEGIVGLIVAYDKYNRELSKFSTYAYTWIWSYMDKYIKRFIEQRSGSSLLYKPEIPLSLDCKVRGEYESEETLQDLIVDEYNAFTDERIVILEFLDYAKKHGKYNLAKRRIEGQTFKEIEKTEGVTHQALNMKYMRLEQQFKEWYNAV